MLKNIAVVAGASRGIGLEISRELALSGYSVIGFSRTELSKIEDGDKIFAGYLSIDLAKKDVDLEVTDFLSNLGIAPTVWVNNLGISGWRSIESIDSVFLSNMFETNLFSYFYLIKAAASFTSVKSIVNLSSIAGKRGTSNNSAYCATKFGITGLTQALAKELGVHGTRVNSVCPVLVATDGLKTALNDPQSPQGTDSFNEFIKGFAKNNSALGRLPSANEVAKAVRWLLSDDASAITGVNLNVDCGVLPQ